MKNRSITIEDTLYAFIFLIALITRFTKLGGMALSIFEADWAFQALEVAQGSAASAGSNPAYVVLTGFLFFLLESSEALARFLPALLGSLLVLVPFLLREKLGRKAALVLAVALALDPGLVSLSRLAGGPMLALVFVALAVVTRWKGWQVAAGIFAGLALLSGRDFWLGALGLLIAVALTPQLRNWKRSLLSENRTMLISAAAAFILAGTFFLRVPAGLNGFGSSFVSFINGWLFAGEVTVPIFLIAFIGYLGVLLALGIYCFIKHANEPLVKFAGLWALAAFLLALLYPSREVGDLVWVSIPLWILTARFASPYFEFSLPQDVPALLLAGLNLLAQILLVMSAARFTEINLANDQLLYQVLVFASTFLIIILLVIVGGLVWSDEIGMKGLIWGLGVGMLALMISGTWQSSARPAISQQQNLWYPGMGAGQTRLMDEQIQKLGIWSIGQPYELDIVVTKDTPVLRWTFRNYPNVRFEEVPQSTNLPAIIITEEDEQDFHLESAYKGQSLVLCSCPVWGGLDIQGWVRWFVFREVPVDIDNIILWTRTDTFPGGEDILLQSPLGDNPVNEFGIDFDAENQFIEGEGESFESEE
jgi:hypothetical protein